MSNVGREAVGVAVWAFGVAVVLTNSARSGDWLHPVHINILGFVLAGVGGALRLSRRRDAKRVS